jgi:hypothetical protein
MADNSAATDIEIKPSHKGRFHHFAEGMGMGTQEAASYVLAHKDKFSSGRIHQAQFAHNASEFGNGHPG